jgi:hypothetical protein
MGLNETHFDTVATHLVETLRELKVQEVHIDGVFAVLGPLRAIFEKGAEKNAN